MNNKYETSLIKAKTLYVTTLCLVGLVLFVSLACEKKAASSKSNPNRISGPCEVFDKLPTDIVKPLDVNFGKKVKLLGITINKLPKDQLNVTYYWQLLDELSTYDAAFVHFTDKDNKVLFQNDHDLCQRRPFAELRGKFIKEPYVISVPQTAKGQEVYVKLGIFSIEPNIGRLKIESAGGVPTDDLDTRAIIEKVGL
ncbi:MAG TPA: hypothetical protein VN328_13020 [Thermodesulfovibrionales bacterium]|nr:hypothetical protein [Thermodesulfovibrionales bacterium]